MWYNLEGVGGTSQNSQQPSGSLIRMFETFAYNLCLTYETLPGQKDLAIAGVRLLQSCVYLHVVDYL